jgi:hypothetical protein
VLRPAPGLDWRTATAEDFELCIPGPYRGLYKSPRLAEFMLLTGGDDLVWSSCDNSMTWEGPEAIGQRILERLDPIECLPGAPVETDRCVVTLVLLDMASECPASTSQIAPGRCALRDDQWDLVETDECAALRARPEIEVPPGASLEIRCSGQPFSAR